MSTSVDKLYQQLKILLKPQKQFYAPLLIYCVAISMVYLVIPIAIQSLVNNLVFTGLFQPILIMGGVVFFLLMAYSFLKALQLYLSEKLERNIFLDLSQSLVSGFLGSSANQLCSINGKEGANRFFDIVTIQKKVPDLIVSLGTLGLQTFVGLTLLAFYHPYFLIFDAAFILMLIFVWRFYFKRAVLTAVKESKSKYRIAEVLEDLASPSFPYRSFGNKQLEQIISERLNSWYSSRRVHFKHLFTQKIILLLIFALLTSVIIVLGGALVVKGELTLGQLVAAEIIVTALLVELSKSGKYLEYYYDLVAAADKVYSLWKLNKEQQEVTVEVEYEGSKYEVGSGIFRIQGKSFDQIRRNLYLQIGDELKWFSHHSHNINFLLSDEIIVKNDFLDSEAVINSLTKISSRILLLDESSLDQSLILKVIESRKSMSTFIYSTSESSKIEKVSKESLV